MKAKGKNFGREWHQTEVLQNGGEVFQNDVHKKLSKKLPLFKRRSFYYITGRKLRKVS